MCGRFPSGLDPQAHRTAIERWMDRQQSRRDTSRHQQQGSSLGSQSSSNGLGRCQDGSEAADDAELSDAGEPTPVPSIEATPETNLFKPSYNIAPSTRVPVMRLDTPVRFRTSSSADDDQDEAPPSAHKLLIQPMKWGLLPRSTKTLPPYADALKTINARDDTVLSGRGMWPPLLSGGKRCVIWAQGFYEWLKKPDGTRLPHFVGMQERGIPGRTDAQGVQKGLMPMAGLWESCQLNGEAEPLYTFTIITTESNEQLGFLHDRMPVILPDVTSVLLWLGAHPLSTSPTHVSRLLKPYSGELECYRVPTEVGKVGNDDPSFILPLSQRKDGIMAAFSKVKAGAASPEKREEKKEVKSEMEEERGKNDLNSETHAPAQPSEARGSEPDDESVKKEEAEAQPAPTAASNSGGPSTKFSPEPFNPPVSPPRPRGGYSRAEGGGTSVYTARSEDKGPSRLEDMLGEQRKRGAFFSEEGAGSDTRAVTPKKARIEAGSSHSATPTMVKTKRKEEGKAKGSADIRSFFGSPVKKAK